METAYWNDYYLKRKGKSSIESKVLSATCEFFNSGNEINRKLKKNHKYLLSKEPSFRTFRTKTGRGWLVVLRLNVPVNNFSVISGRTGRGGSIESEFAWHASGPEFDPHVGHILSWRLGHENISTAILPLPLIQEEQLSVTGERMCTKYW